MQSIRRWKAESIPRMLSIWSLNGKSPLVKSWTIGIKSCRHLKAQKEGAHIIHNLNLFHTCLPAHALTTTKNCSVLDNWKFRTRHSARARAAPRKHRTMFCFRQLPTQPKQKVVFLIGLLLSALLLLFFFIFLFIFKGFCYIRICHRFEHFELHWKIWWFRWWVSGSSVQTLKRCRSSWRSRNRYKKSMLLSTSASNLHPLHKRFVIIFDRYIHLYQGV